ncbi:MAG: hypothetical protein ABIH53_00965 [archaeon]
MKKKFSYLVNKQDLYLIDEGYQIYKITGERKIRFEKSIKKLTEEEVVSYFKQLGLIDGKVVEIELKRVRK